MGILNKPSSAHSSRGTIVVRSNGAPDPFAG
jgi:hypothetical protein